MTLKTLRLVLIPIAVFLLYTASASASVITRPMIHFGLVAYWSFDVGKGDTTVYDMSGNRNHGTLTNMDATQDWVDGNTGLGQALDLDGSNDYVNIGDPPILNISGNITVSAWLKHTTGGSNTPLVARWGTDESYALFAGDVTTANALAFFIRVSNTNFTAISSNTYADGVWHHVVGIFDGSNVRLIVDGGVEDVIGDATSGPIDTPANNVVIGAYNNNGSNFDGQVDDVRIYKRALAPQEVKRLYNLTRPKISTVPMSDGLVGYWSFDVGKGDTTAYDLSGNKNHGTLTNMDVDQDWVDGNTGLGQALDFDNSNDYVEVGDQAILDFADGEDFTLSIWANRRSFNGTDNLISKRNSFNAGSRGYATIIQAVEDTVFFEVSDVPDADEYSLESATTITSSGWNHIVIVWDDDSETDTKIYINGVEDSVTRTGTFANIASIESTEAFRIGVTRVSAILNPFDGQLDEARIYRRALSSQEVTRLYNLTRPTLNSSQNNWLTNGLVGMWSFNGPDLTGAKALDSSGNGNDGKLTNGPVPAMGKVGQALDFDGTNDFVDAGSDSSIDDIFAGGGTITSWINIKSDANNNARIVDKAFGNTFTNGFAFLVINQTALRFGYDFTGGNARWSTNNGTIPIDTWHHVAVTYNRDSIDNDPKFYIDGVSSNVTQNVAPSGTADSDAGNNVSIGAFSDGTNVFSGKIDEVRMYNRYLSADEIRRLYNMGR